MTFGVSISNLAIHRAMLFGYTRRRAVYQYPVIKASGLVTKGNIHLLKLLCADALHTRLIRTLYIHSHVTMVFIKRLAAQVVHDFTF